jgi:hypothetical protein
MIQDSTTLFDNKISIRFDKISNKIKQVSTTRYKFDTKIQDFQQDSTTRFSTRFANNTQDTAKFDKV